MNDSKANGEAVTVPTTIFVCTSCRAAGQEVEPSADRAGVQLHESLAGAAAGKEDVRVVAVGCLGVCTRPVTIALAAPGKWTFVYADFAADSAESLLACARLFGEADGGRVPKHIRPEAMLKGIISKTPPL